MFCHAQHKLPRHVLVAPELGKRNDDDDLQPANDGHLPCNDSQGPKAAQVICMLLHAAGLGCRLQWVGGISWVAGDEGLKLGTGCLHLDRSHKSFGSTARTIALRPRHRVAKHGEHANAAVRKLGLTVPRKQALVLGEAWRQGRSPSYQQSRSSAYCLLGQSPHHRHR